ncbi:MAG: tetratricopeptide repeat protein [Candidatus Omnitrophica bacterium]|nr:tetratricopeptide repeat protein [Candidatus Omnitrophota bacterium]
MVNKIKFCLVPVFASVFFWVIPALKAEMPLAPVIRQDIGLKRQDAIEQARDLYSQAEKFIQKEDYVSADDALKKAQQLLEAAPKAPEPPPVSPLPQQPEPQTKQPATAQPAAKTFSSQAWELSQKGLSKEAIPYYLMAVQIEPKNTGLYYNLAVEYIKVDQPDKAIKVLKYIITLDPKDKDAYYNLGTLYENYFDDKKQALEYYRKYIKYAPENEDTRRVQSWIMELSKLLEN